MVTLVAYFQVIAVGVMIVCETNGVLPGDCCRSDGIVVKLLACFQMMAVGLMSVGVKSVC